MFGAGHIDQAHDLKGYEPALRDDRRKILKPPTFDGLLDHWPTYKWAMERYVDGLSAGATRFLREPWVRLRADFDPAPGETQETKDARLVRLQHAGHFRHLI